MNVNDDNAPPAEKVHEAGLLTMLPEVGLVRPKLGAAKQPVMVPTSAGAKLLPDIVTTVPTAPDDGVSLIVGEGVVTENVA